MDLFRNVRQTFPLWMGLLLVFFPACAFATPDGQLANPYFEKAYVSFFSQKEPAAANNGQRRYLLGPGDTLVVTIPDLPNPIQVPDFNHPAMVSQSTFEDPTQPPAGTPLPGGAPSPVNTRFQQVTMVQSDGTVFLYPFGTFHLEGLTTDDARRLITQMTHYYLKDPQVYIQLKAMRPFSVYVTGRVTRPGAYTTNSFTVAGAAAAVIPDSEEIRTDTAGGNTPMHLSTMLSKVGGVLYDADVSHIKIVNPESGDDQTVNLLAMFDRPDETFDDPVLYPNDHVEVPQLPGQTNWSNDELAASTLSPARFVVRVIGYGSKSAGTVTEMTINPRNRDLWTALSQASIDSRANFRKIIILRKTAQGTIEQIHANSWKENITLAPNDLIVIPDIRPIYKMQEFLSTITQVFFGVQTINNL